MKNEELPYLNLDKATSLYLPFEPIEARAHYRFAFRLANGDVECLLARLCVIKPDVRYDHFQHCVVLSPENAEDGRVFVIDYFEYRSGRRKITNLMTKAAARKFKWDLFEQHLSNEKRISHLYRFWCMKKGEATVLLKLYSGSGRICGFISEAENSIGQYRYYESDFYWRRIGYGEGGRVTELKFLRLNDASFKRKLRLLWNDENSELRYALRWAELNEEERDAIAFECKEGNWEDLREIAKLALQLRVHSLKRISQVSFSWKFGGFAHISVRGVPELDDDDALYLWRLALTSAFGTTNFDISGRKHDSLPMALASYLTTHDKTLIEASVPSMHEILEASVKLEEWAQSHFPHQMTKILIDSLRSFSVENARIFAQYLDKIVAT